MAQPPAPHTNPGLPDRLIVSSQDSSNRLIALLIIFIFFVLVIMVLLLGVLTSGRDPYSGGQSLETPLLIVIFFILILAPVIALFWWMINRQQGTRTVVDGNSLLLEQPGMSTLFIPWQNAHGRITVKVVSQYFPGSSAPAMMALVLVALDQEQIVLPGSLLNSYPHSPRDIGQQTYATAMQILAYDPWGQKEPLMQSENTFTPYVPHNMYMSPNMYMPQNIMRT